MRRIKAPISLVLSLLMVVSAFNALTVDATIIAPRDTIGYPDQTGRAGSYDDWTKMDTSSGAVYYGNTCKTGEAIQMNSRDEFSGIVTTVSGGKVKKITVEWKEDDQNEDHVLDIYGKNSSYLSPADLYSDDVETSGIVIGSVAYNSQTECSISGNFTDIGLRSENGPLLITSITVTWEQTLGVDRWDWADDFRSATVYFTDGTRRNASVNTAVTTPATYSSVGEYTHTATVSYLGDNYTDVRTSVIPKLVDADSVTYIAADGSEQTAEVKLLHGGEQSLEAGWYAVRGDITYYRKVELSGNVNLILCDGATVTFMSNYYGGSGFSTRSGDAHFNIFGQTGNTGKIYTPDACPIISSSVSSSARNYVVMYGGTLASAGSGMVNPSSFTMNGGVVDNVHFDVSRDIVFNGGNVNTNGKAAVRANAVTINGGVINARGGMNAVSSGSICTTGGDVTINGGNVTATGGCGIMLGGAGYKVIIKQPDYLYVSSIRAVKDNDVNVATVVLTDELYDAVSRTPYAEGTYDSSTVFDNRTLIPGPTSRWSQLQAEINEAPNGSTITLDRNYTAIHSDSCLMVPVGKTITLDLNGYTLDRGLGKAAVAAHLGNVITNNGTLKITGNGTITGGYNNSHGGGIINNSRILLDGVTITGNRVGSGDLNGGAGVFSNDVLYSERVIRIRGYVRVTGNTCVRKDGSVTASNVKFRTPLDVVGELSADTMISVDPYSRDQGFTTGLSGRGTLLNFESDEEWYDVVYYYNEARLESYRLVVFEADNGTDETYRVKLKSNAYTAPECMFDAPEGKVFAGWQFENNVYSVGSSIPVGSDVGTKTVTAQWDDPSFVGHSLQLKGQVGLSFYVNASEAMMEDAYVTFDGKGIDSGVHYEGTKTARGYEFTVFVASCQMADRITPTFHYCAGGDDKSFAGEAYSVEDYISYAKTRPDGFTAAECAVIDALADYGYYSQAYMPAAGHTGMTVKTTEGGFDTAAVFRKVSDNNHVVSKDSVVFMFGYRMTLDPAVSMTVRFSLMQGVKLQSVTVNGTAVMPVEQDGYYVVNIEDIRASRLTDAYDVVVNGKDSICVSPVSYIRTMIDPASGTATDNDLSNMLCALYYYADACRNK
ncbi:hypothetical protein SAMN02910456_01132 [Ruminococcaceae bacterium YRB3002]|nr:hypothetical protein SAMN02910456_01132 [Ruminococcaceae bacterium YRB3002]